MTEPQQRPHRSKQDYGTPPEFLAAVKARLSIVDFDCDLAASFDNAVTRRHYTRLEDALVQPWTIGGGWNWLNPPFSRITAWVEKAYWQSSLFGASTAVLIPAAVGSNWWRAWVHRKASVLFLNPRLTFVGCADPYPKDCALLLYTQWPYYADKSYDVWTWKGARTKRRENPEANSAEIQSLESGTAMTGAPDRSSSSSAILRTTGASEEGSCRGCEIALETRMPCPDHPYEY